MKILLALIGILLIAGIVLLIRHHRGRTDEPPKEETAAEEISGEEISGTGTAKAPEVSGEAPAEYVEPVFTTDEIDVEDGLYALSEDTDYEIRVNRLLNCITVYHTEADGSLTPVRAIVCSSGMPGNETPTGTFELGSWYDWCSMVDGSYCQFAYRIIDNVNNDIMFHSVPYSVCDHGALENDQYDLLGDFASLGCLRICVADARWLAKTCGTGTKVVIYDDPDDPGPLGKPDPYIIPAEVEEIRGWDPTDPNPANPWFSYSYTFSFPNEVTVAKGSAQEDILRSAEAADCFGHDVSGYAKLDPEVDTSAEGSYETTVRLDLGMTHASKTVVVHVE